MNKELIFHAKLDKKDTKPDHTIIFYKDEDENIVMGYSRPRPKTNDTFSKAEGLNYASSRLIDVLYRTSPNSVNKYNTESICPCYYPDREVYSHINKNNNNKSYSRKITNISENQLNHVLPNNIIKTLSYYAGRAKKYYKLDGNQIKLIFKGDKRANTIFAVDLSV